MPSTVNMGEAPPVKEHLVIAYARDLPQWLIDETQAKFPDAELSILQLPNFAPIPAGRCLHLNPCPI